MNNRCIVCNSRLMEEPLLVCENMPAAAQHMPDQSGIKSEKRISLELCQCSGCGLVQFNTTPVSYYKDVIRSGGYSTTMRELRNRQYTEFINQYHLAGKRFIEVGCGQGEFLDMLRGFPVEAYGIENDENLVNKAKERGLSVEKGFTESEDIMIPNGPFDAFLSFNFLEHQPEPNTMLRCIYNNLNDDAYGLITVPSFEYIIEQKAYYELLRDHIANYSENTLCFVMEKNGFEVVSTKRVNRDTIEMVVKKKRKIDVSMLRENKEKLTQQIKAYITEQKLKNKRIAVWGASHQGFTILSSIPIENDIEYVIDSATYKHGFFTPGSHLRIVSPEYYFNDPVDVIIIIAPGYTREIASVIQNKYGKQVEIMSIRADTLEKMQ